MKLDIREKAVCSLSSSERVSLKRLTLNEDSYLTAILKDNPVHAQCWLASLEEKIVGWSVLRWFQPRVKAKHDSFVSIYVDQEFRRRGIGKSLIESTLIFAEGSDLCPIFYGLSQMQKTFYHAVSIADNNLTIRDFPRTYWEYHRFVKGVL